MGLAMLSMDGMAQTTRQEYKDILDIQLTPGAPRRQNGCFTDMGSWMGFTLSEKEKPTAGFCGPFSIYYRNWYARSLVSLIDGTVQEQSYYPGEIRMSLKKDGADFYESLQFVDARTALLTVTNPSKVPFTFTADSISTRANVSRYKNRVTIGDFYGERVIIDFPQEVKVTDTDHNYLAAVPRGVEQLTIAISLVEQLEKLEFQELIKL
jgi:putative isomerase